MMPVALKKSSRGFAFGAGVVPIRVFPTLRLSLIKSSPFLKCSRTARAVTRSNSLSEKGSGSSRSTITSAGADLSAVITNALCLLRISAKAPFPEPRSSTFNPEGLLYIALISLITFLYLIFATILSIKSIFKDLPEYWYHVIWHYLLPFFIRPGIIKAIYP